MSMYTIYNSTSGMELGDYEGTDELDAYRKMMLDAGYDGVDQYGDPLDEVQYDVVVKLAEGAI